MKSQYLAEKLDRVDGLDPSDISKQFELVLESDRSKRGFTDLNVSVAAIRLEGLFNRLPSYLQQREKEYNADSTVVTGKKSKKKRTADYQIAEAFVTEWQYTIIPPDGFRPKALPRDVKLYVGPAVLSEEFSAGTDNVVHATLRFDMIKRKITIQEATELRNNVARLKEVEAILIYFEPIGEVLLNEGKVREALQSYRDLVALHPNEAVHHLQIARALLAAGMGSSSVRSPDRSQPGTGLCPSGENFCRDP